MIKWSSFGKYAYSWTLYLTPFIVLQTVSFQRWVLNMSRKHFAVWSVTLIIFNASKWLISAKQSPYLLPIWVLLPKPSTSSWLSRNPTNTVNSESSYNAIIKQWRNALNISTEHQHQQLDSSWGTRNLSFEVLAASTQNQTTPVTNKSHRYGQLSNFIGQTFGLFMAMGVHTSGYMAHGMYSPSQRNPRY